MLILNYLLIKYNFICLSFNGNLFLLFLLPLNFILCFSFLKFYIIQRKGRVYFCCLNILYNTKKKNCIIL